MTPESLLVLLFGLVAGFALGYVTSWRMARKLEAHGVALWRWDRPLDMQATPERFQQDSDKIAVADRVVEHPTSPRLARVAASLIRSEQ